MARNESSGWNKFLNFIGLVNKETAQDTYGEEYSGGNYGRRQTYTPPQQSSRSSSATRRLSSDSSSRSRYDDARSSRTSEGYDDYRTADRPSARYQSDRYSRSSRYETERSSTSRASSPRYDAPRSTSPRASSSQLPARQPQRRSVQVSRRQRTVMYSLRTLKDCCKVIDELIANNTVVLTMEDMDGSIMQRALDTLSGAAFALDANIRKASDHTYLIAPNSVDVNDATRGDDYDYDLDY